MATHAVAPPVALDSQRHAIELACFALCCANLMALAAMYAAGAFLAGPDGKPLPTDFVNVWAAGRMALEGTAPAAYNPWLHKPVEDAALGWSFDGHFGWHYPPPFFFVASVLALLPYLVAHLVWIAATFPLYATALRSLANDRLSWMLAAAFPAVLANAAVGQNGFLTAGLIGSALHLMQRRPVLAGCCLGLLTYKPHFGLLFPLLLLVGRRWTVIASAAATAILLGVASWAVFGGAAWQAFFVWLPETSRAFLSEGQADWAKLQSTFALVRVLGGSETLAWMVQGGVAAMVTAGLVVLWRSPLAFDLKAAAAATGTLLVTPYVYLYDMVVLAVPYAILIGVGLRSGFRPAELSVLAFGAALIALFPIYPAPLGLGASAAVAALILRRCATEWPHRPVTKAHKT